ncbi:N-6 DNA methylase [Hujiaoplasma nucleasis]|uniref:site-specific DNA-methyltransferase (adenine-specific) n=1 Tax=Hujiaoplasma nucleasis TaxID=2725268 RepID=A0A7L6MZH1_9MOLU|nr:N-6 DNA methylase [Hujiaoplasma nucleasis]QLY39386.1 N-6 DNA methylase [Hujiaoplasma nucleasis]
MENKIKQLFWNISNVIRGYHSQREMFDVFVSVFFLYYISDKYNADIRNVKINRDHLKTKNITKEELEVLDYFESLPYFNTFKKNDLDLVLNELSKFDSNSYIYIIEQLLDIDHFEIGEATTNLYLTKLSQRLFGDIRGSFVDLCSGYGTFILNTFNKNDRTTKIDSYELNDSNTYIQKALSLIMGINNNVHRANVLTDLGNEKYDYVFSSPPLGLRVQRQIVEQSIHSSDSIISSYLRANSTEWLFVNKVLSSLKDTGRAVVIVSNGTLFKTVDEDIRKTIIENNMLEGVINLSSGLLGRHTGIEGSLLIFGNNTNSFIKMVDASEIYSKERHNKYLSDFDIDKIMSLYESEKSHISLDSLRENDYVLLKKRYEFVGELDDFITVGDIIEDTFRGIQISSRDYEKKIVKKGTEGSIQLLSLGNISEHFIDSDLDTINPEGIRYQRYILEDGDFIISAKGSKIKTSVYDKSILKGVTVPLGNVMVLRIDKEKYNPHFLKVFLNTPLGLKLLENAQTGSTIVNLNKKNLLELKIPNIKLEEQNRIAVDYLVAVDSYSYALKEVEKKQLELDSFFKNQSWE